MFRQSLRASSDDSSANSARPCVRLLVAYKSSNPTAACDALSRAESHLKQASAWFEKRKWDERQELDNSTVLVEQLRALLSSHETNSSDVIVALKAVAAKEGALPLEFGPPVIFKPTR